MQFIVTLLSFSFKVRKGTKQHSVQRKEDLNVDDIFSSGQSSDKFISDASCDYARYDFGTSFSKPATLKLWLATKRGGEE